MNNTMTLFDKQLEVLGHDKLEGYTEIRAPKKGIQEFYGDEVNADVKDLIKGDVYVGINVRKTKSGSAKDVAYLSCIVLDFDPIRPKDTQSTDAQHKLSIDTARKLHDANPGSVLVSSGSGAHVYIPINPIKVDDVRITTNALQNYTYSLKKQYEVEGIKVDSIFDLSRIIRVWGSHNEKSNRLCEPISGLDTYKRIDFDINKWYKPNETVLHDVPKVVSDTPDSVRLSKFSPRISEILSGRATFNSRSDADYELTRLLIEAHFPDEEILKLRRTNPLGRKLERTDDWVMEDIRRIRSKIGQAKTAFISPSYFSELAKRKPGIMTGLTKLDSMTAGLKGGRLYVIAARPTDGKTTLLTQVAKNLAKQGKRVLYFPTECGASVIYDKIVSSETGINLRKFQFGNFTDDDKQLISGVSDAVQKLPIFVCEDFSLTLETIKKKIQETIPDIVIVDFLQSMRFENGGEPKELGNAVLTIKSYAGDFNVPVILASQLNRGAVGAEVSLTQLKGTGTLEEQGDDIMFLTTIDRFNVPRKSALYVMKSKYGETGIVKLNFHAGTCTFEEVE